MADRTTFQERLQRMTPKASREIRQVPNTHLQQNALYWLVSALVNTALNGWAFFLSCIAFVVLSAFVFLDFIGLDVGLMICLALAAFIYFVLRSEL